jgi:CheY-like chemotaxis protein
MNALCHSGAVILCVDDRQTEATLDLLKRVLEKAGYCVLATTSAHKALDRQAYQWRSNPLIRTVCISL